MKFSMLAIVAVALSTGVHGFAGTPLKSSFAVRASVRFRIFDEIGVSNLVKQLLISVSRG